MLNRLHEIFLGHRTDVRVVADGKGDRVDSSPEYCVESHYWSCASNLTGLTKCAVDGSQEERQKRQRQQQRRQTQRWLDRPVVTSMCGV